MSDKKTDIEQVEDKETVPQNPAMMVKTQGLPTKIEFAQHQGKREKSNDKDSTD